MTITTLPTRVCTQHFSSHGDTKLPSNTLYYSSMKCLVQRRNAQDWVRTEFKVLKFVNVWWRGTNTCIGCYDFELSIPDWTHVFHSTGQEINIQETACWSFDNDLDEAAVKTLLNSVQDNYVDFQLQCWNIIHKDVISYWFISSSYSIRVFS